jgi:D-3-phosphoglycerate dehydrogenase
MKISTDKQTKTIGATLFEDGTQKIVLVDEFRTDIAPKGIYLYIINKDRPGTIGKIGTILGNLNINIAGFHLSRQKSGFAMSFIELDTQPSQEAINLLKKIEDIELVKTIVFN